MGFPSRTSRIRVFVSWKSCCEAGGWLQAVYIDGKEMYIDCDSQTLYIPGTSCMYNSFSFQNLQENPPHLLVSMCTEGSRSLDSGLATV